MTQLYGSQRLVLKAIRDLPANAAGFVTDKQIAHHTRIKLEAVKDWVETLEKAGFVEVARTTEGISALLTAEGRLALNESLLRSGKSNGGETPEVTKETVGTRKILFPSLVLIVLLSLVALVIAVVLRQQSKQSTSVPPEKGGRLDISDIAFVEEGSDRPTLDVKLTNVGQGPVFLKRVRVNVIKTWPLSELPHAVVSVVPVEKTYPVQLHVSDRPYSVDLDVSHGYKPNDFGRFRIRLDGTDLESPDTIYLLNLDLIANGYDAVFGTKNLMYLSRNGNEPTERLLELPDASRLATAGVSREDVQRVVIENRRLVREAGGLQAEKSPSLLNLIEKVGSMSVP